MHGSNRLGGNSLSDLLVFGRRAGAGAVAYLGGLGAARPVLDEAEVEQAATTALAPYDRPDGENPYTVHQELQQTMNDLVGIIRRADEVEQALQRLAEFRTRAERVGVQGGRQYHPGWHLALDLRNMLTVSECVAHAALERTESRGGHTRDDHPGMDKEWRRYLLSCALRGSEVTVTKQEQPPMREDLLDLFEQAELAKYLTAPELTGHRKAGTGGGAATSAPEGQN
jgi:succinate dehydrogenase / fumarate reductase flavoprotein subunit